MHKMAQDSLKLKKKMMLFEEQKNKEQKQLTKRLAEAQEGVCGLHPAVDTDVLKNSKTTGKHYRITN